MKRLIVLIAVSASLALLSTGCDNASAPPDTESTSADWMLSSAPADAQSVKEAKADATEGEQVVVRGRIGGRMKPMTAGSPVFVIMDLSVPHCGQIPGDQCPTPWDYCCEKPEDITANSATVQIVNESGEALDTDPASAGLKPLDEIIVVGTVGPRPGDDVFTIRAKGVYRAEQGQIGDTESSQRGDQSHQHADLG
jgi:hypothetical protein